MKTVEDLDAETLRRIVARALELYAELAYGRIDNVEDVMAWLSWCLQVEDHCDAKVGYHSIPHKNYMGRYMKTFEYIDDAWDTETEHELLEFAKRVAVVNGGLHIQRIAGRGHILWNERRQSWIPLVPGMIIALDDDGEGFHITA